MFASYLNVVVYLVVAVLVAVDIYTTSLLPMYMAVAIFIAWDIGFTVSDRAYAARDARHTITQVSAARQYASWFLFVFGVFFGLLLTGNKDQRVAFISLMDESNMTEYRVISPFILIAISAMFVPIQLVDDKRSLPVENEGPSQALKGLMLVVVFFQQLSVYLIATREERFHQFFVCLRLINF